MNIVREKDWRNQEIFLIKQKISKVYLKLKKMGINMAIWAVSCKIKFLEVLLKIIKMKTQFLKYRKKINTTTLLLKKQLLRFKLRKMSLIQRVSLRKSHNYKKHSSIRYLLQIIILEVQTNLTIWLRQTKNLEKSKDLSLIPLWHSHTCPRDWVAAHKTLEAI